MKNNFYCFLVFTVFYVTLIAQDAEANGGCCNPYKCCYFPKCCSLGPCCTTDNTTVHLQIMWDKIPEELLTAKMRKLRQELIAISNTPYQQAASLGSIFFITGLLLFNPNPNQICVFNTLIKKVIQEREGCIEGLDKAIETLATLIQQNINISRTDILVDIKCATRPPLNPSSNCELKKKSFNKIMQIIEAPAAVKNIITKLYTSKNPEDQKVAIATIVSFTEYSVQYFNLMMATDAYRAGVQYYTCVRPIPKKCCSVRDAEFAKLVERSWTENQKILAKVISRLPQKPKDSQSDDP